jgi:hypothetical protein
MLVIRITNNQDRLGPSSKVVEKSAQLTCLEITGCYRIKYSRVLWLLELQIRRGRKVQTEVGRFYPFLEATKALRESRGIAILCF